MYSKIKIYSLFLLLLLSIGQNNAQQGCWLDDLTTILESPGNSEFKSFIGAHDNGFMKFRALHEVVGSRTARTNNNVLRFYASITDEVKDKITTFTHRQVVDFTNDFGDASNGIIRNLDAGSVDSWKLLDEAGVDIAVRKNVRWLNRVQSWIDEGLEITSDAKILINGREVGWFGVNRLNVKYSGYGGNIICDPNRTTTLLGKWQDPSGGGTIEIIDSKLSRSGQNIGGPNVLNVDIPRGMLDQEIWDNFNQPWLRQAINRGDVIRVVSDPRLPSNIYKPDGTISFFGREHDFLTSMGYSFNSSTFTYIK